MTGNLTTVFQRFILIISCICIMGVVACEQQTNQNSTSTSANTENSGSFEETASLTASLLSWAEVGGFEAGAVITRLYIWAGLLFVEYETEETRCDLEGLGECQEPLLPCTCYDYTASHIVKQVAPGQWEDRSASDPISKETNFYDLPDDAPDPAYKAIKFTTKGRCVVAVAADDGVHFFEDGFGWKDWNDGLPSADIRDFAHMPEEGSLYAVAQGGLYKLSFDDVVELAAESQLPESERQCVHDSVTIQFD